MIPCIHGLRSFFIADRFPPISILSSFSIVTHSHSFIIFCSWLLRGILDFSHVPQTSALAVFIGHWVVRWGFIYLLEEQQFNHFSLSSLLRFMLIDPWRWPYWNWIHQSETIGLSFISKTFPLPFPFGWLVVLWNPTSASSRPRSAITSLDSMIMIYPFVWFNWGEYC